MHNPLPKMSRRYVETDRGDIHLAEAGAGDNTLVMLSITSFGGVLLDQALPQLAARGYRVLALDLMGYGRSDRRTDVWRVEDFADNIVQALERLEVTPRGLVCGHFSGWTGIEIASRGHPGLQGLVLDGTPIIARATREANKLKPPAPPAPWTEDGAHAVAKWKMVYGLIKKLDPHMILEASPSMKFRQAYLALLESVSFDPGTMDAATWFEIEEKMPLVRQPTLVMCGDYDWNLPHHPAIVAALPDAREVRFADTHPLHELSRPDRAAEYVEQLDRFFLGLST
ncbi:alpha/beta fold hydrolase [Duganella sp. BuS-21]|uniref:alpha/beta fold hydrolase n=1 Tax=Duganella sp. BuS-21 TaxID=2943848 RepID=UPI0035A6C260